MATGKKQINILAPAKVNLFLEVLGRRKNGYHDIRSVIVPISIYDRITISKNGSGIKTETKVGKGLKLNGDTVLLNSNNNLATKAAVLLKKETGYKGGAIIKVEKNIPVGGGLGGGSADAAAVLIGLNQLWELGLSKKKLMQYGAKLGCDIPAFIMGGPVKAEGLGEKIAPLDVKWGEKTPRWWIIVANPCFSVSTGDIYARCRESLTSRKKTFKNITFALKRLDIGLATQNLFNGLQKTVFKKYPIIEILTEEILKAGAVGAQVSGSGASVFGLARNEKHARSIADKIKATVGFPVWNTVARLLPDGVMVAHGPLEARV